MLKRSIDAFRGWLEGALGRELGQASRQGDDFLMEYVVEAGVSFERVVRAFQDRVSDEVERALALKLPGTDFVPAVDQPSHPDLRLDKPVDTSIELLWFLVPMLVFRPLVLHHFRRQLPWEAEKNLVRLAGQWSEAVGASIEGVASQAQAFIAEELITVESLLAQPEGGRVRMEEGLRELEVIRARLATWESVDSAFDRETEAT